MVKSRETRKTNVKKPHRLEIFIRKLRAKTKIP